MGRIDCVGSGVLEEVETAVVWDRVEAVQMLRTGWALDVFYRDSQLDLLRESVKIVISLEASTVFELPVF